MVGFNADSMVCSICSSIEFYNNNYDKQLNMQINSYNEASIIKSIKSACLAVYHCFKTLWNKAHDFPWQKNASSLTDFSFAAAFCSTAKLTVSAVTEQFSTKLTHKILQ